jgi:hypothetical protein
MVGANFFLAACGGLAALTSCGPIINGEAVYSITGTISGAVSAGVSVTWSGGGDNGLHVTVTDASGKYGFTGLEPAHYTVTPSLRGYEFIPGERSVELDDFQVGASQDFTSRAE